MLWVGVTGLKAKYKLVMSWMKINYKLNKSKIGTLVLLDPENSNFTFYITYINENKRNNKSSFNLIIFIKKNSILLNPYKNNSQLFCIWVPPKIFKKCSHTTS